MTKSVSIGICAYNEARRMSGLLDSLSAQVLPVNFEVTEILVVASGCTDGTDRIVEERAKHEPRLSLIRESERRGKSVAINEILRRFHGDILVLVNADARLLPGALLGLLEGFDGVNGLALACGLPSPEPSMNSILNLVEDAWWSIHNRTLQTLSDRDVGNHCCDEFMAMRRGFADSIPTNVVNDGSYFGVLAALHGITVRLCPKAAVIVETPSSLSGLLQQRRRIISGHRQVEGLLGRSPSTLEGLVLSQPTIAARILAAEFSVRPIRTSVFLVLAGPLELISHIFAFWDRARSRGYRSTWPIVE